MSSLAVSGEVVGARQCPISWRSVSEIQDPVVALPCGHLFERAAVEMWMTLFPECPLDKRKIEKLEAIVIEDLENVQNDDSPSDATKRECLRLLESCKIVEDVQQKNFTNRADQISVAFTRHVIDGGIAHKVRYKGAPINQLFEEYCRNPGCLTFGKPAYAEIIFTKNWNYDGSCRGTEWHLYKVATL
jgi:hypothetical protein